MKREMKYLKLTDLKFLMIDITSRCNLTCPGCARLMSADDPPNFPKAELSLKQLEQIFKDIKNGQLKNVLLSGNYGDASNHSDLHGVIDFFKSKEVNEIWIYTNGSFRDNSWWGKLGKKLNSEGDRVHFSIDGLAETNSMYRTNSNFEKIISNVKSFIELGGKAQWDFILFDHNKHQAEDAKTLARELGFVSFNLKQTRRFLNPDIINKMSPKEVKENQGAQNILALIDEYGSWEKYLNETPIKCKFKSDSAVFLDFSGNLWPCTWIGAPIYYNKNNTQYDELMKLYTKYGTNFNSVIENDLSKVLNHPWFENNLCNSWEPVDKREYDRISLCGKTCGEKYEHASGRRGINSTLTYFDDREP